MILRFESGRMIALPPEQVVIDAEREQIDVNQRSVWWDVYQYGGASSQGFHRVGAFIHTVHNDGHSKSRRTRK